MIQIIMCNRDLGIVRLVEHSANIYAPRYIIFKR